MNGVKMAPLAIGENDMELGLLESPRRLPKELDCLGDLEKLTLSWNDLNVFIPKTRRFWEMAKKSEKGKPEENLKQILRDCNGLLRSGQCVALMGSSGAGKTTLLNTLNGRNRGKIKMEGVIAVNGRRIGASGMAALSGYVQQTDLFIPTLTVREHLEFHAALRMDSSISRHSRALRVKQVIADLGLSKCADTRIGGGARKGISGGEMKRLAFASEVLTDPPLLFCDEPTTGLDAFMAQTVVDMMRKLAGRGKLIVCTIHQPASETFLMFDQLLLLAEGRTVYLGPREDATLYFDQVFHLPVPEDYNPADHFINTLSIIPGKEDACKESLKRICDIYERSESNQLMLSEVQKTTSDALMSGAGKFRGGSAYKASWAEQMRAVLWRSGVTMWREPMLFRVRVFQVIVIGLLFGFIYYNQKMTNEGIMNINGILYMLIMQMTMGNVFAVVATFTGELPIFLKEHHNAMYRSDVYYLCKLLIDIPVFLFIPFIFVTIVYWIVGLYPTAQAYFITCAIGCLVANVAVSFGSIVCCSFQTTDLALAVGMTVLMPLTLFGGLFLSLRSIPDWLKWIEYISWFRYANEALSINQWEDVEHIDCTISNYSCPRTGPEVLQGLGFQPADYLFDIGILFAMIVAFRSIAYTALYFRVKR